MVRGSFSPVWAREWRELGSVQHWFSRLAVRSHLSYYTWLYRYCGSVNKSPDELLAWTQQFKTVDERYKVLDSLQAWVTGLPCAYKTKEHAYASVRSFLLHNRTILPRDPSFRIRSDKAPVERKLTIDNLRELIQMAPLLLRSALLVKWMGLLDTQGLIYVSNEYAQQIVNAIKKGETGTIVRLRLPGRKRTRNIKPFYTFIGFDALNALREYFERERGYPKAGQPIWIYTTGPGDVRGRGLTEVGVSFGWMRLLRKARLIPKPTGTRGTRYGFNVHNTRDLAISLLETVPSFNPTVAQFLCGHEIDDQGYNQFYDVKPQYVEQQYKLAEPYLNILSNQISERPDTELELKVLKDKFNIIEKMLQERLGLTTKQLQP